MLHLEAEFHSTGLKNSILSALLETRPSYSKLQNLRQVRLQNSLQASLIWTDSQHQSDTPDPFQTYPSLPPSHPLWMPKLLIGNEVWKKLLLATLITSFCHSDIKHFQKKRKRKKVVVVGDASPLYFKTSIWKMEAVQQVVAINEVRFINTHKDIDVTQSASSPPVSLPQFQTFEWSHFLFKMKPCSSAFKCISVYSIPADCRGLVAPQTHSLIVCPIPYHPHMHSECGSAPYIKPCADCCF